MKTVSSISELQRLAAKTGAVVKVGGRVINAGGEALQVGKPPPREQPPVVDEPKPEELMQRLVEANGALMREAIASLGDKLQSAIAEMKNAPPPNVVIESPREPVLSLPRPKAWNIECVYDSSGRIVNIRAEEAQHSESVGATIALERTIQ
jgi:hypothetical protein